MHVYKTICAVVFLSFLFSFYASADLELTCQISWISICSFCLLPSYIPLTLVASRCQNCPFSFNFRHIPRYSYLLHLHNGPPHVNTRATSSQIIPQSSSLIVIGIYQHFVGQIALVRLKGIGGSGSIVRALEKNTQPKNRKATVRNNDDCCVGSRGLDLSLAEMMMASGLGARKNAPAGLRGTRDGGDGI